MQDALKATMAGWAEQLVSTVEHHLDGNGRADLPALTTALQNVADWAGGPRADDVIDAAAVPTYRRIALHHGDSRYEALLIVWPPNHETPIHDHDGLWGMEIVLDGVLEVEAFDLSVQPSPALVSRGASVIGIGEQLAFSRADYAHRCRNLSAQRCTLSLHIYGGELNQYQSYHHDDAHGWHSQLHHTLREAAFD